jgi:hypothetical protein
MIKQQEFVTWLENPVTKMVFKLLEDRSSFYLTRILDGIPSTPQNTLLTMGEHIGRVNSYTEIINIHYEDFDEIQDQSNEKA